LINNNSIVKMFPQDTPAVHFASFSSSSPVRDFHHLSSNQNSRQLDYVASLDISTLVPAYSVESDNQAAIPRLVPSNDREVENDVSRLPNSFPTPATLPNLGPYDIAVFWDYENVPLPPLWSISPPLPSQSSVPSTVANRLRIHLRKLGRITSLRLYSDYSRYRSCPAAADRSFLSSAGFDLIDCPSQNGKESVDRKIVVDCLTLAWDREAARATRPFAVVLVSGDGDYSYVLSKLRDRGVYVCLLRGEAQATSDTLVNAADESGEFYLIVGASKMDEKEECKLFGFDDTAMLIPKELQAARSCANMAHDNRVSKNVGFLSKTGIKINSRTADREEKPNITNVPLVPSLKYSLESTSISRPELSIICAIRAVTIAAALKRNPVALGCTSPLTLDLWAADSSVAVAFFGATGVKKASNQDRAMFKATRSRVILAKYVQAGRRKLGGAGNADIVCVNWADNAGQGEYFSSEVFLKLTESGVGVALLAEEKEYGG